MSINERIYKIDQLLSERRFVTIAELLERLDVSNATLKRDLSLMRDRMNAPIIFDRELGGYRFDKTNNPVGGSYELPGLWFSADEIRSLLTMHHLISNLDTGGLLGPHIQPLQSRLTALLGAANDSVDEVQRRIKIRMVGVRHFRLEHFEAIGSALLKRKRLQVQHYSRGKDVSSDREISPQRMIYYRGNWYLDAWCHLRNDLRSFSVDTINRVEIIEKKCKEISEKRLDDVLGSGYGIFAGKKVQWATLLFAPEIARWLSKESWHSEQKGVLNDDGSYALKIPYSEDTELLMDILKYGAQVKVISPVSLVKRVAAEIEAMKLVYVD